MNNLIPMIHPMTKEEFVEWHHFKVPLSPELFFADQTSTIRKWFKDRPYVGPWEMTVGSGSYMSIWIKDESLALEFALHHQLR